MNELSLMIKNILDMECEHIKKGIVSKEFAGVAIDALLNGLIIEEKTENDIKSNQLIKYLAKWCKIYIENVDINGIQK